ncbi:hypothetical protein SCAR479_04557 [Seiridium cardinale]|uniref:Uncharacterized protein n=1 Tax=Seiridium cardinale TaxID=138064 RepID=A0ABR2XXY5_9PEZI
MPPTQDLAPAADIPHSRTAHSAPSTPDATAHADAASKSALTKAKHNLAYLFNPKDAAHAPAKVRTRALLRSLRYIGTFVFWRIVRYGKYALVGSVVAALSATAFGSVVTGVGWIVAPPTIAGTIGIGTLWAIGKWGFSKTKAGKKMEARIAGRQQDGRAETTIASTTREDGQWRDVQGPRAIPW